MAVVRRNTPEDVRAMPALLGIATLAICEGGCDFLGQVVVELELANAHMGQFFTPYDVSRMMAEMTMQDAGRLIAERGFVTVHEPASGAGGMIVAAADVLEKQGFDIGRQLYVDGTDLSPMCFRMAYLQASLRGIPATIRRGNTLSREIFDQAVTPAFPGFYATHQEGFDAWLRGEGRGSTSHDAEITQHGAMPEPPADMEPPVQPARPVAPGRPRTVTTPARQLDLFGEP